MLHLTDCPITLTQFDFPFPIVLVTFYIQYDTFIAYYVSCV
jgi:hypothetical protein